MSEIWYWNFSGCGLAHLTENIVQEKLGLEYASKTYMRFFNLACKHKLGDLLRELESQPFRVVKDLLIVCFVDPVCKSGQSPGHYADFLRDLVCAFPEVTFRFIEMQVGDSKGKGLANVKRREFSTCDDAEEAWKPTVGMVRNFLDGERDLYDPSSLRCAIREGQWSGKYLNAIESKLEETALIQCGYVVEDEKDYADLVCYCIFRSGLYRTFELLPRLRRSRLNDSLDQAEGGVLVHAWHIPEWPGGRERGTFKVLEEKHIFRMVITGAANDDLNVIGPNKWEDEERYIAWKEKAENGEEKHQTLRGLRKPLGWIHDIQQSGLIPEWTAEATNERRLLKMFLDGNYTSTKAGHSAPKLAQDIAQRLLIRSRGALKNDEPVLSAVFALEAMRWLRGRSATLFLDCLRALYEAETELEVNIGSLGGTNQSNQSAAPQMRAREASELMDMLSGRLVDSNGGGEGGKANADSRHPLMPRRQVPEVKERIWTDLRQRYLDVGAFEAAEEALVLIHAAHRESIGLQAEGLTNWIVKIGASLKKLLELCLKVKATVLDANRVTACAEAVFSWAWDRFFVKGLLYLFVFIPRTWLGDIISMISGALLVVLILKAPFVDFTRVQPVLPWSKWIPVIVLASLVLVWMKLWPRAALAPRQWFLATLLSILVLSAGNLALLSNPSSEDLIVHHRVAAYFDSVEWTSASLVMGQEMTGKFLFSKGSSPTNSAEESSALSFGWRGVTRKATNSDDPDLLAERETQFPRTILWLENILTGWLAFAMGLSTLYRRATRG